MLTGEVRARIDRVWDAFWSGGIANPLEVIEQITYLLFIRGLDDVHTREENKANRLRQPMARRVFPEGRDERGLPYEAMRWSRFRNAAPAEMFKTVSEHVFPFIREMGGADTAHGAHMKGARFTIPTPGLLAKVVDLLADIPMEDRDTKGDLYEYMLGKIASAGQNGQFRTPRHIIGLMVEMMQPTPRDTICDPACGTAGFLVGAGEYLRDNHPEIFRDDALRRHFHTGMFHGFDFDGTMLRIGSMNMLLHGVEEPDIRYKDSLAEEHGGDADRYSLVLANPPFAGSLDTETIAKDLQTIVKTKKTELLFLFAKNQDHAEFIEKRFNAAYPAHKGQFARVVTYKTDYAQSLIDDFSEKDKAPHIAISVDMLDTGIDVPEVVNLVFFKMVRSKTKFWQMMGRGTRLCADLFGPGEDKAFFRVFDYCGNLEFFGQNPDLKDPAAARSLSERLFAARLDLVRALDEKKAKAGAFAEEPAEYEAGPDAPPGEDRIRADAVAVLRETIAGMHPDNFAVRQKRRIVDKYLRLDAWIAIDQEARDELIAEVAPLPSAKRFGTEEAKRFDLLMFSLELALLKGSKRFGALRKDLLTIASALEEQTAIPGVAAQALLIEEIQTDQWWEGVTVPLLEFVRLRLRDLIQHIEKRRKAIVYSDFADEIGEEVRHDLPQVGQVDFVRFKQKARAFLRKHEDHITLHRLRQGKPLTASDLGQLEAMLIDAGIGNADDLALVRESSAGFGGFVRSLVGLDRQAVQAAFGEFADGSATAEQIEFIGLVVDHLTERGVMEPGLLYESPFTDVAPQGPGQVFGELILPCFRGQGFSSLSARLARA